MMEGKGNEKQISAPLNEVYQQSEQTVTDQSSGVQSSSSNVQPSADWSHNDWNCTRNTYPHSTCYEFNNAGYSPYSNYYPPNAEGVQGNTDLRYFGEPRYPSHLQRFSASHSLGLHRPSLPPYSEYFNPMSHQHRFGAPRFPWFPPSAGGNFSQDTSCACNACRLNASHYLHRNHPSNELFPSSQEFNRQSPPDKKHMTSNTASASQRVFPEENATSERSLHDDIKSLTVQLSQVTCMFKQFMISMDSKIQLLETKLSDIQSARSDANPVNNFGAGDYVGSQLNFPSQKSISKADTSNDEVPQVVSQADTSDQDHCSSNFIQNDVNSLVHEISNFQGTCYEYMNSTDLKLQNLDERCSRSLPHRNNSADNSQINENSHMMNLPPKHESHLKHTEAMFQQKDLVNAAETLSVDSEYKSNNDLVANTTDTFTSDESSSTINEVLNKELPLTGNKSQPSTELEIDGSLKQPSTTDGEELEASHGAILPTDDLPAKEMDVKQYFYDLITKCEPEKQLSGDILEDMSKSGTLQLLEAAKTVFQNVNATGDVSLLDNILGSPEHQQTTAHSIFQQTLEEVGKGFKGKEESAWDVAKNFLEETIIKDNNREEAAGYLLKSVLSKGESNPGLDFVNVLVDSFLVNRQGIEFQSEEEVNRADRFLQAFRSEQPETEFQRLKDQIWGRGNGSAPTNPSTDDDG